MEITLEELNRAFDHAENMTAKNFMQQTCSMENVHGEQVCPICFFRSIVKSSLGIENANPPGEAS
jgi:hypothetical protein